MSIFNWRKRAASSPGLQTAKIAQVAADVQLMRADKELAESERRRVTLSEIRRNNHFTPSIFPEAK